MKLYPLHVNQHAYQHAKSTETTLHTVVQRVEKAINANEFALATFLDIEGAFDATSIDSICNAAKKHGVPDVIIRLLS